MCRVSERVAPPPGRVVPLSGAVRPAGYLVSHRQNDAFVAALAGAAAAAETAAAELRRSVQQEQKKNAALIQEAKAAQAEMRREIENKTAQSHDGSGSLSAHSGEHATHIREGAEHAGDGVVGVDFRRIGGIVLGHGSETAPAL